MKNKLFVVMMLTLPSLYNSMFQILTHDHTSNLRTPTSSIKNQLYKSNTLINNNHYLQVQSLSKEKGMLKDFVEKTLLKVTDNKEQKYTDGYILNNDLEVKNSDKSQKHKVMEFSSTNSPQTHENKIKHEFKYNESQTDNLNKLLDAIKQKITNITKLKNKTSTTSPTEKSIVKLSHQCFHQGELCEYCNSNYCNFNEENAKHWCFKYCKNCQCC